MSKDPPTSKVKWTDVREKLPSKEKFGPYPTVQVVRQGNPPGGREPVQAISHAELRYFGGDPGRPVWCSVEKPHTPIENDFWYVTHWAPLPGLPAPVKNPKEVFTP